MSVRTSTGLLKHNLASLVSSDIGGPSAPEFGFAKTRQIIIMRVLWPTFICDFVKIGP